LTCDDCDCLAPKGCLMSGPTCVDWEAPTLPEEMLTMGKRKRAAERPAASFYEAAAVESIQEALEELDPAEPADREDIKRLYLALVALLGPDDAAEPFVTSCGVAALWRLVLPASEASSKAAA